MSRFWPDLRENQTVRKAKEEYRYETEEWRKPTIGVEDKELFSEHGRILDNVCYRSHWFVLVKAEYGGFFLLVKHGAGEERISLGFRKRYQTMMQQMDSDTRYYMMHALMQVWHDGEKKGRNEATAVLPHSVRRRQIEETQTSQSGQV